MNDPADHGPGAPLRRPRSGFTMLELVTALAIVAVLLALAVPGYQRYLQRAERAEAIRALLVAAACQERVRARGGYYDTSRCLDGATTPAYAIRIEPPDDSAALAFTLIAEPLRPRAGDPCGSLRLDQAGTRGISGDADALTACWGGR